MAMMGQHIQEKLDVNQSPALAERLLLLANRNSLVVNKLYNLTQI